MPYHGGHQLHADLFKRIFGFRCFNGTRGCNPRGHGQWSTAVEHRNGIYSDAPTLSSSSGRPALQLFHHPCDTFNTFMQGRRLVFRRSQRSSQPLELHRCHCTARLSIRRVKWDGVVWKGGCGRSPPTTRKVAAMARAAAVGGDGEAPRALGAAASISVIMTVPVTPQTLPSPIPQ
ncbi:hypothetical protein NGA_0487200, partial [Nannochloropsis gaditana CCMP526]|uniref:uncharacterized protein n=1 Tax=Nannochloropsis gaditana (strain CCMP526) TaxID=1093141 RepID=UPI00029F6E51